MSGGHWGSGRGIFPLNGSKIFALAFSLELREFSTIGASRGGVKNHEFPAKSVFACGFVLLFTPNAIEASLRINI